MYNGLFGLGGGGRGVEYHALETLVMSVTYYTVTSNSTAGSTTHRRYMQCVLPPQHGTSHISTNNTCKNSSWGQDDT